VCEDVRVAWCSLCLTAVAAGCDWPMFRGWFDHTGHNLVESAISLDSLDDLEDSFRGPDDRSDLFAYPSR
jgi:hypothetical protein